MKKYILILLLLFAGITADAQPFLLEKIHDLPDYEDIQTSWGDIDGDGLLDVVVFAKLADQTAAYCLLQQDSVNFSPVTLSIGSLASLNFQLKDFDHDGHLDIIYINGFGDKNIVIARNMGNMSFDLLELDHQADEFLLNDIDRDGDEDIIASIKKEDELSGYIYLIQNDTAFIEGSKIEGVSLIRGLSFIEDQKIYSVIKSDEGDHQLGFFMYEEKSLIVNKQLSLPPGDVFQFGDLNHDGSVDIAIAVEDQIAIIYRRGDDVDEHELYVEGSEIVDIDIGDIDLDGLADIVFTALMQQQAHLFFYKNQEGSDEQPDGSFFELNDGFANELADINDDGDLDLLSVVSEDFGLSFYVQLNQTTISNKGPKSVFIDPPTTIYDQTIFSWNKTTDDHTDTLAISYELFIEYEGTEEFHTMPGYDMDTTTRTGFRNVVGHGYQWFDRQYKAKSLDNGRYYWGVVGVDNAYYASSDIRDCKGGPCVDVYTPVNCLDLLVEDTVVCFNSILSIDLQNGDDSVKWYSVKKGFLEKSPILNFKVLEPDTIFGVYYPQIPCGEPTDECILNYSIAIDVEKPEGGLFEKMEFCSETENVYEVEGEWDSVRWWYEEEIVARGNSIVLDSIPEKPVVAEAFLQNECPVYDTLKLVEIERLLDPTSLPDSIAACIGQPTQIDVFEDLDAERFLFLWEPAILFDEPETPDPYITTSTEEPVSVVVTQDECYTDTIIFGIKLLPLPEITTNGDQEIFRGEKVLLIAEGAEKYSWTPEEDLQSPNSGTTWGEPPLTVNYVVVGADEQGCVAESTLKVTVKNSVFIPDLFSPNGDGRNDFLHVYGEEIGTLSFRVFDERGSLMAELDETSNAAGWNGMVSGNEMPSGTYFWTVSGEFTDGEPISYQGKNKGSIRLMR